MERRITKLETAPMTVRAEKDEPTVIHGVAAVIYNGKPETEYQLWADVVERILPGAFDKVAADDVRALFNHDPSAILGRTGAKTLRLAATKAGLQFEVDLPDTQLARDLAQSVDRGDITGASFSFDITGEQWRKEDGVSIREITGLKVYDVGPVTFPAYHATAVGMRAGIGILLGEARESYEAWAAQQTAGSRAAYLARARAVEVDQRTQAS